MSIAPTPYDSANAPPWFKKWVTPFLQSLNALMQQNLGNAQNITLQNFANDAAAAAGGVQVGGLYRNGSALMVRAS